MTMTKQIDNLEDYNVRDLLIEELIPSAFENCIVTIFEGHHTLDMPTSMTGMVFSDWMKTKAGIFSKDVQKFTYNKPHGKYVLYEGHNKKIIARLIDEEELLIFESLKLVHGHLKDVPYMILKELKDDEVFTNVNRYITTNNEDKVHDDAIIMHDESTNETVTSISLFTE